MQNKIFVLGEAYGEQEEKERTPFVGPSGWLLTNLLQEAGIERSQCFLTNVFNLRPPGNKIETLCCPISGPRIQGMGSLAKTLYLREEFMPELERLQDELIEVNPNVIIALGNTALWALTNSTGIMKARGVACLSTHTVKGFKLVPTYHPAYILRNWNERPVTVIDLIKARREAEYPEIRRPKREIWIEPEIIDIKMFFQKHVKNFISVDIETVGDQITCIGFAPNPQIALVIPIFDFRKKDRNYWDQRDEYTVWMIIKSVLENGRIRKLFQNGMYDIAFLYRSMAIRVRNADEDTMLMHHALYPESLKGLGFLGSIYTDEGAWKGLRKVATIKQED